jgi:outer membrane receptor protein involved in Fe transport
LGITWTAPKGLSLRGQARYVGRFYYDTTSSGGPFETPAHTVFDMAVSHSPTPWMDWRLSVINLTNLAYSESTYTGGASAKPWAQSMSAPRTLNAGITVRF